MGPRGILPNEKTSDTAGLTYPRDFHITKSAGEPRFAADFHFSMKTGPEQVRTVKDLAIAACELLSRRHEISGEEMSSWSLLDGEGFCPRGHASVAIGPVIHLGRAIVQVLGGTLTEAPRGVWWFFGVNGEQKTIVERQELTLQKAATGKATDRQFMQCRSG